MLGIEILVNQIDNTLLYVLLMDRLQYTHVFHDVSYIVRILALFFFFLLASIQVYSISHLNDQKQNLVYGNSNYMFIANV